MVGLHAPGGAQTMNIRARGFRAPDVAAGQFDGGTGGPPERGQLRGQRVVLANRSVTRGVPAIAPRQVRR